MENSKVAKKLKLSQTTLDKLDDSELEEVQGGTGTWCWGVSLLSPAVCAGYWIYYQTRGSSCDIPTWGDPGCPGQGIG